MHDASLVPLFLYAKNITLSFTDDNISPAGEKQDQANLQWERKP